MPASGKVIHGEGSHGSRTAEYKCWLGVKARCYRPKNKDYPNWGGRGIVMCPEWRDSYAAFLRDMGRKPTQNHTIDRLDPGGNYEPGNCRWATLQEQGSTNRRDVKPITVRGVEYPSVKAACVALGFPQSRTNQRLLGGWPVEAAFSNVRGSRWDRSFLEAFA